MRNPQSSRGNKREAVEVAGTPLADEPLYGAASADGHSVEYLGADLQVGQRGGGWTAASASC